MRGDGITTLTRIHLMRDFGMSCKLRHVSNIFLISFPGVQKPLDEYGPSGDGAAAPAKGADDDDDDFDLFGSEDEEEVSRS